MSEDELRAKFNKIVVDIAFGLPSREDLPGYVEDLITIANEHAANS